MNQRIKDLAEAAGLEIVEHPQEPGSFTVLSNYAETLEKFARLVTEDCITRISYLRGFSGYIDGKIVDTPKWNAAIEAAQEVLTEQCINV